VLHHIAAARRALCAGVLACFLPGASLFAQFQVGLAVPFENKSPDPKLDWISESFAETLTTDLASPRFLMIDRRERITAFDGLGMPPSAILTNATIYKVAEALDANQVILGRYDYQNNVFTATAHLLEMQGPSLSRPFIESGPLSSLLELQAGLAWQIQRHLRPDFPLSKEEYLEERDIPRLDAFENYVRGLLAKERSQQVGYYRAAQRLDAAYTRSAFELGMFYFRDRDYPTSAPWFAKLRPGDPDYLEANYFLGLVYLHMEQYERSVAAFRVVEQQLPLSEVYNNLGIALARLERPGALQYFEKAVESDPEDPDYQFNLAYALWKRGNYPDCVEHLALALDAGEEPLWLELYIECLEKSGQREAAQEQRQLLETPSARPTPQMLAKLERIKDTYDGASFRQLRRIAHLQEEVKHSTLLPREHAALHFEKALEFQKQGAERQASDELELVIDYDPEDARAYVELGGLHLKNGRYQEAERAAERSLQRDKSPEAYLLLARVYADQGRVEDALEQVGAALLHDPANAAAIALRDELNARALTR
jgi:tetratricopeptide (TPR) repeat protein